MNESMLNTDQSGAISHCDIAIVGGGMVGLSLALMYHRALPDCSIQLIEAHAVQPSSTLFQPSFDSRSTPLSPSSVGLFEAMGVWSDIAQHVTEIAEVNVSDKGHMGFARYTKQDNAGEALGYVVDNRWLGQALVSLVTKTTAIECVAPAEVHRARAIPSGYAIEVASAGKPLVTTHCQLLVVADGAQSGLRDRLGIASREHDYQQDAIIANVAFTESHQGRAFERFSPAGPLALLPLGGSANSREAALVWTHDRAQAGSVADLDDASCLALLQKAFGFRLGRFVNISDRHRYPLKAVFAQEQIRSSLVLMGNAAHFLHPVAGQGFNLALRDGAQLIECIVEGVAAGRSLGDLGVLQNYLTKQHLDQRMTHRLGDGFIDVFASQRKPVQLLRNLGLLSLSMLPPLKHQFFTQMMGKGVAQTRRFSKLPQGVKV